MGARRCGRGGVLLAVGLAGAVVLGGCGTSPESPDDALAAAQAFVSDASAFRFDAAVEATYVMDASDQLGEKPDPGDASEPDWPAGRPGTTTTDRSTISGSWTPDGWEAETADGYGRSEMKVLGTTVYLRDDTGGGSDQWQSFDAPPLSREDVVEEIRSLREAMEEWEEDGEYVDSAGESTSLAASVYLGGQAWGGSDLLDDPSGFLRAIEEMSDPALLESGGGTVTVSSELTAPAEIEQAWGAPLPVGVVELTTADDGAPIVLTLSVSEGDESVDVEIRFSGWNEPREVTPPDDADIDRTPWIDEEGLAALSGITLLRPTAIPEGWELDYVGLLPGEESPEGCDQVEMHWSPEIVDGDEDQWSDDYLSVYLLPSACAQEADDTPFEVGSFPVGPSREVYGVVEVLVGDTVVQLDSSLTGEELAAVVASIAPTDVATLGAEVSTTYLLTS